MTKTLREFLEVEKKKQHRNFYFDDELEKNPMKYCPTCSSSNISVLKTHNLDGYDYKCQNCEQTYSLILCNKGEIF